jgi:hypothetical protein
MYTEASLEPERCTTKANQNAGICWIKSHSRQIDQFEDVNSPSINTTRGEAMEDEAMEEDTNRTDRRAM